MCINYSHQADDYLEKQTNKQAFRIKHAISSLPFGDVKKLKGIDNGYRLRIGAIRVLFEYSGGKINVVRIDKRGDVYKK